MNELNNKWRKFPFEHQKLGPLQHFATIRNDVKNDTDIFFGEISKFNDKTEQKNTPFSI